MLANHVSKLVHAKCTSLAYCWLISLLTWLIHFANWQYFDFFFFFNILFMLTHIKHDNIAHEKIKWRKCLFFTFFFFLDIMIQVWIRWQIYSAVLSACCCFVVCFLRLKFKMTYKNMLDYLVALSCIWHSVCHHPCGSDCTETHLGLVRRDVQDICVCSFAPVLNLSLV